MEIMRKKESEKLESLSIYENGRKERKKEGKKEENSFLHNIRPITRHGNILFSGTLATSRKGHDGASRANILGLECERS